MDASERNNPRLDASSPAAKLAALKASLNSMQGYSQYVALIDVVHIAQKDYGYEGTMEEAAALLGSLPELEVETADEIDHVRIVLKN